MGGLILVALVIGFAISYVLPLVPVNFQGNKIAGALGNALIALAALLTLRLFRK